MSSFPDWYNKTSRKSRRSAPPKAQPRRIVFESLENRVLLVNEVVAENLLPGNPQSEWDIVGAGDTSIEGYATDISVDQGSTVRFKVNTNSTNYRLDIYRLGYYGGLGARKVATVQPTLVPFSQPDPITDFNTGLIDAGNWAVTASWNVPQSAVSGVYIAKLVREDGIAGSNHIVFVVRDDDGASDLLYQTSDTTWQAYNNWGGNSLYAGFPDDRAYKVSYNRPFATRGIFGGGGETNWVFWAEYPMIRWLEKNGYDVSYSTDVDTDRRGAELLEHQAFLSVGHDEYWSGQQRANVEAARNAGVDLAFFSGNDVYWKTRWENSIDGSGTPYRTLVTYKETKANAKIDPLPNVWTGTWRDPRFSPPADGGRPENALSGTIFTVNRGASTFGTAIQVPEPDGKMRFWRNTTVANLQPGEVATLSNLTLGYEWNEDLDNGFRPAGLIRMSSTTENVTEKIQDYGTTFAPGTATHSLTLYRAASGALVFSAGTVQWSFGLDGTHDGAASVADPRMQQATVNLFADMGVQPETIQANLALAIASTDFTKPTSVITSLATGLIVQSGSAPITISGTAGDVGGVVGGVELSLDGGTTWRRAEGRGSWSYSWVPSTPGTVNIKTRASDDSLNLEVPGAGITITVVPDNTTAPQITSVAALVVDNQTAVITWTTDEASNSKVIYGTSPANLNQNVTVSAAVTNHSVMLAGLTPNTNYYYRAVSVDEFGNQSTSPVPPGGPNQVSTPAFTDTTQANFQAGTFNGTTTATTQDGEVILQPTVQADFAGSSVPAGWSVTSFAAGGGVAVGGGAATIDGARLNTDALYGPGRSLEFVATFSGAPFQSIGFGVDLTDKPWAIFGSVSGGSLYARTASPTGTIDTLIPGNWLGAVHRFRIAWSNTSVGYYIDDVQVASHLIAIGAAMRPIAADANIGGGGLAVDWMRMSPYAAAGEYLSRVFDAGSSVVWTRISWIADLPAGTSLVQSVRMGDTPTPDANWTDYVPIATSGANIGGSSRYLQYRTQLATSNLGVTPVLHNTALSYSTMASADTFAPTIIDRTPAAGATNVSPTAAISVKFSELMNPATIGTATIRLRATGASSDVPAIVIYVGSTATLQPLAPLVPDTTYTVTVSGTVADRAGNPLGPDVSWSYSTGWLAFVDSSLADFSAGQTGSGTSVAAEGNGELILAPQTGAEFSGSALPLGWFSQLWSGSGSVSVSSGQLTVDGAMSGTSAFFGPGQTLQFVATFTGDPYQHVGFGVDFGNMPWAIFSTGAGGLLRARTSGTETAIPGVTLGVPHQFQIDWTSTGFTFLVDGAVVASHAVAVAGGMRPLVSDAAAGGGAVTVDWLRMLPYAASGTYLSRVFDAGSQVAWAQALWNAAIPAGTALALSARVGNTAVPDSSWTEFVPLAAFGASLGAAARYAQYRIDMTGSAADNYRTTPTLQDIALRYSGQVADTTSPAILSRSPAPSDVDVAVATPIVVTFNDLVAAASVTSSSFRLRAVGAPSDVPATLSVSGSRATLQPTAALQPKTTYQVTLASSITDLAGNSLGGGVAWSFATAWLRFTDSTAADFSAGSGTSTTVTITADGEVTLAPLAGESFNGSALPPGWTNTPWAGGGGTTVAGGAAAVDGARLSTDVLFQPGAVAQFTATFSGDPYQHLGLGTDLNGPPWAIFSTREGNALYARTSSVGDTQIPGNWLGSPHNFRIEWTAASIRYLIDDVLVVTHNTALTAPMRALASDAFVGGGSVLVSDLRVTPYVPAGSLASRVFDAGAAVIWDQATWAATVPAGTSLAVSVRMGQTAVPDATWTEFVPLASSGTVVGGASRYLQYRADLATTIADKSAALESFSIRYSTDPDTNAPVIISRTPGPAASGVDLTAPVRITFGELIDPASVTSTAVRLRVSGSSTDLPASVTLSGGTVVLQPSVALQGNTSYDVVVAGTIRDLADNSLGADVAWSFTTGTGQWLQTLTADFAAGAAAGTAVTSASGGEVQLAPALADDFTGSVLGSGWTVQSWASDGGGPTSVTVSGGALQMAGAQISSTDSFANQPLSARVRFGATPYQHFGLATSLSSFGGNYWAIFSTGGTTNTLFARVNVSGAAQDVNLGPLPSGFHDYRIVPLAGGFQFYVDGQLKTTISATFPPATPVRAVMSSYLGPSSGLLEVDNVRIDSFATSGSFVSSVFDASRTATWSTASWTAAVPAGTTLVVETRSGDTATPDGTWSGWTTVANGGAVGSPAKRYLQYRITLTTTDSTVTPILLDILFRWS